MRQLVSNKTMTGKKNHMRNMITFSSCCCFSSFFPENVKTQKTQKLFYNNLSFIQLSSVHSSQGGHCLLLCQACWHFWHCYYCSSPCRTTPPIAVYHFDNFHYSSNVRLSRPPTVPRHSNQIWEAPNVLHLANKSYHCLLRDCWATVKSWLDKSGHM